MKSWIKAHVLLILIALVWVLLLLLTWRGWYQVFVTVLAIFIKRFKYYAYNLWMTQDQEINVIFGGNPDVTISSKVGYLKLQGSATAKYMAKVIDWLFYITVKQKNHCVASIEHDEQHFTKRG